MNVQEAWEEGAGGREGGGLRGRPSRSDGTFRLGWIRATGRNSLAPQLREDRGSLLAADTSLGPLHRNSRHIPALLRFCLCGLCLCSLSRAYKTKHTYSPSRTEKKRFQEEITSQQVSPGKNAGLRPPCNEIKGKMLLCFQLRPSSVCERSQNTHGHCFGKEKVNKL